MHCVGRYTRVRGYGPGGLSAPYILDRGRAQDDARLLPGPHDRGTRLRDGSVVYDEWVEMSSGLWQPSVAGGAYTAGATIPRTQFWNGFVNGSQTTVALDSAYTYNSAGDAIGVRFSVPVAETVSNVYFFIASYTGTAANVNDINLQLRNNSDTVGPDSTLHDSASVDPASATGWIKSTGWTFTLTAGAVYWLIVGDADGNGTDYATVLRHYSAFADAWAVGNHISTTTTDGYASVRTFSNVVSSIVIEFSSGRTAGNSLTASATSASSTNQRGLRFIAPASASAYGYIAAATSATTLTQANLWSGANGPSGTPQASGTTPLRNAAVSAAYNGFLYDTGDKAITQGTTYRATLSMSAANTFPRKTSIGTGADDALRNAMWGLGEAYFTESDGTTDWSNDDTSALPEAMLLIDDFTTASGGGGISQGLHTIMDGIVA